MIDLARRGRFERASKIAAVAALLAQPAFADPCTAIPDRGPSPAWLRHGATFAGPVVYVGDGDGLCLASVPGREADKSTWAEVRLANFYAPELHEAGGPEAKAALERVAKGKAAICIAGKRSYDRIVAVCTVDGVDLGEAMRRAGISEGGRGRQVLPVPTRGSPYNR